MLPRSPAPEPTPAGSGVRLAFAGVGAPTREEKPPSTPLSAESTFENPNAAPPMADVGVGEAKDMLLAKVAGALLCCWPKAAPWLGCDVGVGTCPPPKSCVGDANDPAAEKLGPLLSAAPSRVEEGPIPPSAPLLATLEAPPAARRPARAAITLLRCRRWRGNCLHTSRTRERYRATKERECVNKGHNFEKIL